MTNVEDTEGNSMSEERLKSILTSMSLSLVVNKSTNELFLIDGQNRSYAAGDNVEELLKSWDAHGGYSLEEVKPTSFWLGGVNGIWMTRELQDRFPALTLLGKKFNDFQNGQWRGEWKQQGTLTYGQIRDILLEAAVMLKG